MCIWNPVLTRSIVKWQAVGCRSPRCWLWFSWPFNMVEVHFSLALGLLDGSHFPTSTLGRNVQHINLFCVWVKAKSSLQQVVCLGNISVYGSSNLPCSTAGACLADLIPPLSQMGSAEPCYSALSFFPPDPKWARHTSTWTKWVTGHVVPFCKWRVLFCSQAPKPK